MTSKYLQFFPKPLLEDLVAGKWLPIVGAGMSLNATLPQGMKMPLWDDLGRGFADELPDYSSRGALDSISAYEHEFQRPRMIQRMTELLHIRDAQPGSVHREFCSIPFDIVCTTNFDFLLERGYALTPRYVHPVLDEQQLSIDIGSTGTLLLKLHGDVHHPHRMIATEADYDGFLTNYPLMATYLANQLITKTALFVGYSLDDADFRQIWHVVANRLGQNRRGAYTLGVGAKSSDMSRFERRGVKVINLPGSRETYNKVLSDCFRELREYMLEKIVSVSKVTEEQPLRELLLPRNAPSRLCFFSLPLDLLPFYRERVFPAIEEAGLVPVTADDLITPGNSITAKIDTLIDRAAVMVVEIGSSWTRAEFELGMARIKREQTDPRRPQLQLIAVSTTDVRFQSFSEHAVQMLQRPENMLGDSEGFIADLVGMLSSIAKRTGVIQAAEPVRLFEAKEYRAAVISAMSLLEAKLRGALAKQNWAGAGRSMGVRGLIDKASELEIIPPVLQQSVYRWSMVRNEVVHTPTPVGRGQAKEIVDGVMSVISRM